MGKTAGSTNASPRVAGAPPSVAEAGKRAFKLRGDNTTCRRSSRVDGV
jgi:hypothetical protein